MGALYRDLVRKHSKAKGSARALLNILADYATNDGMAWPSRETLANDTGMSERNVTRCLQTLCEEGRLALEENAKGGRGRVPVYKILFPELEKGDKLSPKRETDCHPLDAERVTNASLKGDKSVIKGDKSVAIPSYARIEPQEPKQEPKGESAPARIESPEPTSKTLRVKSRHLDPRHFVGGYIPAGTGANPIEVYYERFSINHDAARLNVIKEDDLTRLCPDLDKLRDVVVAYSRTTFQPGNVQLILDWYEHGVPDKHKVPGSNGARATLNDSEKSAILTRAKTAAASKRTAEKFGGPINPQWELDIQAARSLGL